ncbi:MAG TPA: ABC transporter ATP-binding protein [Bacilli bacterium]|nr:ABC transporter ATP-binding protein [Bacilli bacterium]HQC84139.1 ABC transporter ATP-binding protein [Bacilli bacterium]
MKNILSVNNICKSIGKKQILKNVSFNIEEGEILGFIGPNGAGKTTTIKLILGLQSIDSGTVKINGYDIQHDFEKAIARVGGIVESPDLYMYLTGRQNLMLIKRMYKDIKDEDMDNIIELIGLKNRIDDKVSKYSLGMRQRLGIGAALISNPNVLILDEPTNGLDPEGIKDIRDLIKKLAKERHIGVLISSHNLSELESMITDACIIKDGTIITTQSVTNLKQKSNTSYLIELNKTTGIKKLLLDGDSIMDDTHIRVYRDKKDIPELLENLIGNKFKIYEVQLEKLSLEDAFLEKTGGNIID